MSTSGRHPASERSQPAPALAAGDAGYRGLFNEMQGGVALHEIICDAAGKPIDYLFLDVNPAFEELTGLRAADIIGKRVLEIIPDLEPEWIERYGRVALTGRPEHFENYNAALGRYFEVKSYSPAPGQFAAVFHDVTDLRERSAFVETIITSVGEGLIVYDRDLRYVVWNPVMEELTGLPAADVLGRQADELFAEVMAAGVGDDLEHALAGGTPTSREFEYVIPRTGRKGWVVQTNRPHRNARGEIVGVVSSVLDITARHMASIEATESEERFRTIFDNVGDGVTINDLDGHFVEANRVACERLGYTREEFLALSIADINSPAYAPLIPSRMERLLAEGALVLETAHVARDGHEIPIEALARRIEYRGKPAVLTVQRDITERKRAEVALRDQAVLMQQLLDAIPIPIIAKDGEGRIRVCNDAFAAAGGKTRQQIVGETVAELGITEPERHQAADRVLLADGVTQTYDAHMPIAGQGMRRHAISKSALRSESGEITGIVTAALDIDDRYQAEQALRRSEERFRTLFEHAGDSIFIADVDGRIWEANRTACERLGYRKEELIGLSVGDIDVDPVDLAEGRALMQERGSLASEARHRRRDGTIMPVEMISTMIELGGQPAVLSVARDISERRRAEAERETLEEQLRQAQKMEGIGRLAGGIAHDFNNLLTAIRGSATLALMSLPADTSAREDLEQIELAADRAAGLTRQLVAFARRTVLQPEVVDLGAVVRRLEPMLTRLIGEDVKLVTIAPNGTGYVLADPGQLEQVIVNLVVNSRDAMPDGGTIAIEIADAEVAAGPESSERGANAKLVTLKVTDTGVGMDADTLEHVFEPFFTTKGPGKGTGLGLSTVYGIVRQSGGSISARSEPGVGSAFTVSLPRVERETTAAAAPARTTDTGRLRTGTILVVEDDSGVRRFASRVLELAGYRVVTAGDGTAAVEAAEREPLQLLLTDVIMPGMSGREVAARLTSTRPELRVLYMSGHTDKGIVQDGILDPEVHFLAKPFSSEALLAAVDEIMAGTTRS